MSPSEMKIMVTGMASGIGEYNKTVAQLKSFRVFSPQPLALKFKT
jgi:hypothetical protein